MESFENQNKPDYSLPELPAPTNLTVHPRRIVPRVIFWPVFLLLLVLGSASTLAYLDRSVWHQAVDELLPESTEMLLILPASAGNRQLAQLKSLAARLPASAEFINFNIEAAAAADPEISHLYSFWQNYKPIFGPQVIFAKLEKGVLITVKPKSSLTESEGEKYLGENIFKDAGNFYLWQSGGRLFASENPDVLKEVISIKYKSQITRPNYWLLPDSRPKTLESFDLYKQSFKKLPKDMVAGVYLNSGDFESVNKTAETAVKMPKLLGDLLSQIKFSGSRVLSLGLHAGDNGLSLRVAQATNDSVSSSRELLSIPAEIGGAAVDAYWQVNNFESYGEALKTLGAKYGIQPPVSLNNFSGGAAIFANLEKRAFGVLAESISRSELEQFGSEIISAVKVFAPDAKYEIRGAYLAISNNDESVQAILDKASAAGINSQKLDTKFYLKTSGLVSILENLTSSFASTDVFEAWEILSRALPVVTVSAFRDGQSAITDWFMEVRELSAKDKVNAEKVFGRLSGKKNETLDLSEVKDAARRADLAILENAIREFSAKNERAPDSLLELVPIYVGSVPVDPATNAPYPYKNTGANLTFYLQVAYDGGNIYCLTSKGVNLSEKDCTEQ